MAQGAPFPSESAFTELLRSRFASVGEIPTDTAARLYEHYGLLLRWNKVLNLTRIERLEDAVERHFCESLLLGFRLSPGAREVLDVGSGAGFPGIPMAALRAECSFTLAEAHHRKAVFLKEATRSYCNVFVAPARAEQIGRAFDWVVSRAVQWEDVVPLAAANIGLLLGEEDAARAVADAEFEWQAPESLPWGTRRVLILGRRRRTR